ncbi:ATP-binding cassette sub-family C member 9-like [Ruditapes philippinarum]|uniref:ATP-binding cassette sub-family C member 9-like n=1 Tax=Ruditapes philippinarum TaxID=129788 RepID=UPI00295BDC62|nr:ATP-binding cassette sub-family C member 9-like [Ruditapes philippinarum]
MSFCGSREGSLSVKDGVLRNKCFVDVMNIIPHGLFIVTSIFILIAWRESIVGRLKAKTWVHFRCHSIRWILTLFLILINAIEIAEGFVSDYIDPDSANYHVIVPPCFSLVSTILTIVLYHNIEMFNSPRVLLILIPYWISACGLKLLKAFSLYVTGIAPEHLRLWITWAVVLIYGALILVELVVLFTQRYAFCKKPKKIHAPPELERTRYYANFVNFLSKATFWWVNDILIDGFKSPLTQKSLGKLPSTERALTNYKSLLHAFEIERDKATKNGKQPSLHKIYLRAFWPLLLLAGIFRLCGDLLAFVGPWCIESIVDYAYALTEADVKNATATTSANTTTVTYSPVSTGNLTLNQTENKPIEYYVTVETFATNGYGLCVVLFIATVLQHTLLQNHHYTVIRQGIRLRSAIQTMVYSKALRLSTLTITNGKTTVGQIVNHMSMDSTFLMMQFFFIHYTWATPIQVALAMLLMYFKLGVSAVIGGLLIVLSAPAQVYVGRGMSSTQKKVMQRADVRVKRCNEMIQGMKVIKLLAWESFIAKGINEARKIELKHLLKNAVFRAMFTFIGTAVPAIATLLTFVLYPYIEKEPLTAGKALSTLALFNILYVPLVLFSVMTSTLIMANVSAKRLMPYFLAPEVEGLQGFSDTIKTGTESLPEDLTGDPEHIQLHLLSAEDKHDGLSTSMCSLASHHSHAPGAFSARHSRQNSSSSLLEYNTEHLVNPGFPRRHSAITLSAVGDHHHHHHRRRQMSGVSIEELQECDPQYAVEVSGGAFSWDLETKELALKNIDLQIPSGKLIMVVGTVGSGKSSLLSALLGEMLTVTGKVQWCRNASIAYVSQKPWLLNKTLKENILFGNSYSWKRFQKVIEACALQPDIDSLPAGDATEIGEKGINLSGGQKQRISIARALYSTADIIIMDDPLSALDAHVGRHVFDDVVMKKLMRRKKTVILVTHQLQYLNYAHSVLVMKDGEIACQGKLTEVKKTHPDLYESWRKALKDAKAAESVRKDSETLDGTIDHLPVRQFSEISQKSQVSIEEDPVKESNGKLSTVSEPVSIESPSGNESGEVKDEDDDYDKEHGDESKPEVGKLIKKEHREVGSVSIRVYFSHIRACGIPFALFSVLTLLTNQTLLVSTNIWVSHWASKSTEFVKSEPHNSTQTFDNWEYIPTYIILSICAVLATLISGFAFQLTGIRGAKNLHVGLLNTVLHVPMRFFDTNPSGRIINRFSSDVGQIDQKIPATYESLLRCAFASLGAIIVNCIGTPYFLLAALPVCILYYLMQKFYTATARELQRLDSVTKSPIFSHLSETLNGLMTIRAYKAQVRFRQIALSAIDNNVLPFLFNQTANRWLGIRLDYMGAILVFVSSVASLTAGLAGNTDPAFIGLCIAYALMVSNYLNWIVRNSTELEMMMNAVERVDEYTQLKTETTEDEKPVEEECWPTVGEIEFRHVSLCYDINLDPVVNDVSFIINPGEKIGICGRTGSGKSSLTLSLFRMIEISAGEILIDGKNISNIALPELRSKLAIIPQDPILFTGTIRYNLDPGGEMDDNKLWKALESVQLKDTIDALPNKLDSKVSEGGENFSIGQKQLFCLARAFLRENKILVLDEATASIDLETDNKLQKVIGTVFKDKTVITIAHRISTIMKYDRVMTMASGRMLEFDSPKKLMEQDSYFARLVKQSSK